MDPSLLCEVTYDDRAGNLDNLTEDDIVLLDGDYQEAKTRESPGAKRPFKGKGSPAPPVKKVRRLPPPKGAVPGRAVMVRPPGGKLGPRGPHSPATPLSPAAASLLKNKQLSVSSRQTQRPSPLKQSITWKYKQLAENQYTADIRKPELLKNHEPEQCDCKVPKAEGKEEEACGNTCINRSTYSECDPEVCKNGTNCTNMSIQRRQYAPGLERFMTAKKGWGVRARQSISKGSFILEYTGEICSSKAFEARMLNRYTTDNHHYCLAIDNKMMIDAHRAGSECRFVNHSCEPNCEMEKWTVGGLSRMALFSLRDILPGEEICYDYNFSLFNTDQGQECKCGAKSCRGVIGGRGKDYLITIEDEPGGGKMKSKPVANNGPAPLDPNSETAQDLAWFSSTLSATEFTIVQKESPRPDQLEAKNVKCTVCYEQLNYKNRGDIHRHPELGVVICTKCLKTYGRGGWTRDDEGNDEFCRWCSEGGQIYLCDFCPQAFCSKCLRWNLGRKYLKKIEDEEKWHCLNCDSSPLRGLRATYWAVAKYHKDKPVRGRSVHTSPGTPKKGAVAGKAVNGRNGGNGGMGAGKSPGQNLPNVHSAYNKLQKNNAISVGTVAVPLKPKMNGVHKVKPQAMSSPKQRPIHFMDTILKETEASMAQFLQLVKGVRRDWGSRGRGNDSITITAKQLRTVLERGKARLSELDRKVVNNYRLKVKDSDIQNIRPGNGKEVKAKEKGKEVFAKAGKVGKKQNTEILAAKTVPDPPVTEEDEEEYEVEDSELEEVEMLKHADEVQKNEVIDEIDETENIEKLNNTVKPVKTEKLNNAVKLVKTEKYTKVEKTENMVKDKVGKDKVEKKEKKKPDKKEEKETNEKENGDSEKEKNGPVASEPQKSAVEHLVIVATEGEAVIKDVMKTTSESVPLRDEKEEEGILDVSVDELEIQDEIHNEILEEVINGVVRSKHDVVNENGIVNEENTCDFKSEDIKSNDQETEMKIETKEDLDNSNSEISGLKKDNGSLKFDTDLDKES